MFVPKKQIFIVRFFVTMVPFRCLVLVLILGLAEAAIVDWDSIDDQLSLFWNTKNTVIGQGIKSCTGQFQGQELAGQCQQKGQCLLSGGQLTSSTKYCGVLGTCCIYQRSCSKVTSMKVSYFTSSNGPSTTASCDYTVRAQNKNICQMRLDFEDFSLWPATPAESTVGGAQVTRIQCRNDRLTIDPSNYGIPELCGENSGQHVYVHLEGKKELKLSVTLDTVESTRRRSWRIKITQLECLTSPFDALAPHKTWDLVNDNYRLAPNGSIQFFYQRTGVVRSFNFGFDNPEAAAYLYPTGLRYAISFRKDSTSSCVQFRGTYLNLRLLRLPMDSCVDYLEIQQLQPGAGTFMPQDLQSRICSAINPTGPPPGPFSFSSNPPGPIVINFISADTFEGAPAAPPAVGFELRYSLANNCA